MSNEINKKNIANFVFESDASKGEEHDAYWRNKRYQTSVNINSNMDPFSDKFAEAQMKVYEEMSGRKYSVDSCEETELDVEDLRHKPNAYHGVDKDPAYAAKHSAALGSLIANIKPMHGTRILELGSGWGYCAEFFGHVGLDVTAVDINAQSVKLNKEREKRFKYGNKYFAGSFESFETKEKFDIVFFYESIHHSNNIVKLLKRVKEEYLAPGGKIILGAEPYNNDWPAWGMRLDPLSTYCINKFGWFESGWQRSFVEEIFRRMGMGTEFLDFKLSDVSNFLIASESMPIKEEVVALPWSNTTSKAWFENDFIVVQDGSSISLERAKNNISLCISNFSGSPRNIKIYEKRTLKKNRLLYEDVLPIGKSVVELKNSSKNGKLDLVFKGDNWNPDNLFANGDDRNILGHISKLTNA
jgi:2-polyprenyl-3-methyl-5-hydroxy-6-metoxy-1,4-benzoquinol methylase